VTPRPDPDGPPRSADLGRAHPATPDRLPADGDAVTILVTGSAQTEAVAQSGIAASDVVATVVKPGQEGADQVRYAIVEAGRTPPEMGRLAPDQVLEVHLADAATGEGDLLERRGDGPDRLVVELHDTSSASRRLSDWLRARTRAS
jgi:hypothetical protein